MVDPTDKPLSRVVVNLISDKRVYNQTSDAQGQVTFKNVTVGKKALIYVRKSKNVSANKTNFTITAGHHVKLVLQKPKDPVPSKKVTLTVTVVDQ